MDSFDHGLFELGYNLVFAGHFGWDVKHSKRILEHPLLGKQLFYVENGNNTTIDYLYKMLIWWHFQVLQRIWSACHRAFGTGIPVIASDYNVIYEVGQDYAEFFHPEDEAGFTGIFRKYHENPALYDEWKQKIQGYEPFSWEQAEEKIVEALLTLKPSEEKAKTGKVRQMVMLTARTEDLLNTMPFIEAYMPFVEEIVICCPDKVVDSMRDGYKGNVKMIFMPDSKVLAGRPLPEDHTPRNFFLRCLLMQQDVIDDVFIMSDDDYRPLFPITQEVFFDGDKYRGNYFYEMHEWRGCQGALTSFDRGVHKTLKFCEGNKYPTMQFNSHIPQAIEKAVFVEMVKYHEGMEMMGFDEWSMYFNYLMAHYPNKVSFCEYRTLNWPGSVTDWTMYCQPGEFVFENYYSYVYSSRGLFAGMRPEYNEQTLEDNKRKMELVLQARERYNRNRERLTQYYDNYRKKYGESPVFCITNVPGSAQMFLPREVELVKQSCNRIDLSIFGIGEWKNVPQNIEFMYYYVDRLGRELQNGKKVLAATGDAFMEVPFVAPYEAGKYTLCCEVKIGETSIQAQTALNVTDVTM